ncbi:MAG: type II secretion system protein [Erysipelotrichales bacterium]|nr:type II secretion system protein [Erysipelotrichales bacterium]
MKNKNGFVFMETIVVIAVLSITLILLFSSYSYILRKSRTKKTYDVTETIYKTYYFKQVVDSLSNGLGLKNYIKSNSECQVIGSTNYICSISSTTNSLYQLKTVFEIDKYYLVNPKNILTASNSNTLLNSFDATTIDYIVNLGEGADYDVLIVKYKKVYDNGEYEVYHSSMEVN